MDTQQSICTQRNTWRFLLIIILLTVALIWRVIQCNSVCSRLCLSLWYAWKVPNVKAVCERNATVQRTKQLKEHKPDGWYARMQDARFKTLAGTVTAFVWACLLCWNTTRSSKLSQIPMRWPLCDEQLKVRKAVCRIDRLIFQNCKQRMPKIVWSQLISAIATPKCAKRATATPLSPQRMHAYLARFETKEVPLR